MRTNARLVLALSFCTLTHAAPAGATFYAFVPDDDSAAPLIHVIDLATDAEVGQIAAPAPARAIAAGRTHVYAAIPGLGEVLEIEIASRAVVHRYQLGTSHEIWMLELTLDESRLYVTRECLSTPCQNSDVTVIDIRSRQIVTKIPFASPPYWIVAHPNGAQMVVSSTRSDELHVINIATHAITATLPAVQPHGFAVDASWVAVHASQRR
jgi:DNA-binding beta-propeller fold protein YncE